MKKLFLEGFLIKKLLGFSIDKHFPPLPVFFHIGYILTIYYPFVKTQ
jgi:hypothetical protein